MYLRGTSKLAGTVHTLLVCALMPVALVQPDWVATHSRCRPDMVVNRRKQPIIGLKALGTSLIVSHIIS